MQCSRLSLHGDTVYPYDSQTVLMLREPDIPELIRRGSSGTQYELHNSDMSRMAQHPRARAAARCSLLCSQAACGALMFRKAVPIRCLALGLLSAFSLHASEAAKPLRPEPSNWQAAKYSVPRTLTQVGSRCCPVQVPCLGNSWPEKITAKLLPSSSRLPFGRCRAR